MTRRDLLSITLIVVFLMLFNFNAGAAAVVDEKTFKEIEANLMCTDGCGMYLKACDNATAEQMRFEIREKLAEGATPEQIYAYMISIYGEEVMAAPPPNKPFNITAWVLPFVAILGGGLVIYLVLDKGVFLNESSTGMEEQDLSARVEIEEYLDLINEKIKEHF